MPSKGWIYQYQQQSISLIFSQLVAPEASQRVTWMNHHAGVPVTTRIITFLVGDPYKPAFVDASEI